MDNSYSVPAPGPGDALVLIDPQNDFLPGGSLAVPHSGEILPVLNRYLDIFRQLSLPVFFTRDWHPADHCSFKEQGGPWPPHCVQGTPGAEFAAALGVSPSDAVISKAMHKDTEAYSDFDGTGFADRLKAAGIRRLFIGGLATDYCVLYTVRDGLKNGFQVCVLEDAIRAVDVNPGDGERAVAEMQQLGSHLLTVDKLAPSPARESALWTDLYQLTMLQGYHDGNMNGRAVFEFFVRELPANWNFLLAAGLDLALAYLETLHFTAAERGWMRRSGFFHDAFIDSLEDFRFSGDVDALPEGTVFFPDEPVLSVSAPLAEAQLVETRVINLIQHSILVASKAARMVLQAKDKQLIDFGCRRAHGAEAGLLAARASYLAGFAGTATVQAGALWGIPVFGTMAHSFILAHARETEAFRNFARSQPRNVVLLIDTFDTEKAAGKVVALAPTLAEEGITIRGVRLDSGDLASHAFKVRAILDAGGLGNTAIFASGDLDEHALAHMRCQGAPIDGFGIGTRLTTSADAPYLNCAYKLEEYDGEPKRKTSEGKATWPGKKQVIRRHGDDGRLLEDCVLLAHEAAPGEGLLAPVMRAGKRLAPPQPLDTPRQRARREIERLPEALRGLEPAPAHPVRISAALKDLADTLDRKHRSRS
ncbi:MAG: nicotinate phosphoribosyltransferase [Nitrospinaceae bacterium]|nr:MAG: nicotinate phosphoribosyltransferase [Nitrospinaceae bacterium]